MRLAFVGSLVCASLITSVTAWAATTTTSAGGAQVKAVANPVPVRLFVRQTGCTIRLPVLGDAAPTSCHFSSGGSSQAATVYRGTAERGATRSLTFSAPMDAIYPKLVTAIQANTIIPTATANIAGKTYTMTHISVVGVSAQGQGHTQSYTATLSFRTITST